MVKHQDLIRRGFLAASVIGLVALSIHPVSTAKTTPSTHPTTSGASNNASVEEIRPAQFIDLPRADIPVADPTPEPLPELNTEESDAPTPAELPASTTTPTPSPLPTPTPDPIVPSRHQDEFGETNVDRHQDDGVRVRFDTIDF